MSARGSREEIRVRDCDGVDVVSLISGLQLAAVAGEAGGVGEPGDTPERVVADEAPAVLVPLPRR